MLDPENKESLRQEAKRHRDLIDPVTDNPEDAVEHFLAAINPQAGQVIAGYWPKGREFDSRPILDECLKRGCLCALPVVQKDSRVLKFAAWNEGERLEKGLFDIMVPAEKEWIDPDILMVPLLAFDRKGGRLGYGGGHYDATIAALAKKKKIVSVGIGYAQQAVLFNLPAEEHDQPMDWIITPRGAIKHG